MCPTEHLASRLITLTYLSMFANSRQISTIAAQNERRIAHVARISQQQSVVDIINDCPEADTTYLIAVAVVLALSALRMRRHHIYQYLRRHTDGVSRTLAR